MLGLRGPAMSVDTACSSSLTAVHLACQSLRQRECEMALAGGVNAMLIPDTFYCLSKGGMMAPDGHCKAFDESADGFVRAEGCGVLVLKRLSQAMADRDPILAVIRGSAANHDGASGGLTVPNGIAQQAVIKRALANSSLKPNDIDYIETHGTGTSLGDPIELEAIDAVMGEGRHPEKALIVGSVKSNIGHLESAAGVASLVKVILALQHREIPANLHFNSLNSRITLRRLKVVIPTEMLPWQTNGKLRRAGVSSFGFSGTNVHIVLEQAPSVEIAAGAALPLPPVLTLSAKSEPALRALVDRYTQFLTDRPEINWADVCFTTNTGRSRLPHRLAVAASSGTEALQRLAAPASRSLTHWGVCAAPSKVAFLFTGQGAQYAGMGRGLFAASPVFRAAIEKCDRILSGQMDRSLISVLYPEEGSSSPIDETAYTQVALFSFEYAMSELWRSWGVVPDLVLGHSLGEYVAAHIAGVFSLEDVLKLVAARGRLMQALPKGGAMASVCASEELVRQAIDPYRDNVSIAALNAPSAVVISGAESSVASILTSLGEQGIEAKRLVVSHAFHSPLIEPMLDEFEQVARRVTYFRPRLPIVSNVTGQIAEAAEITTPEYWRKHVRSCVRFADGVAEAARKATVFLEVGPAPTLIGMARESLKDSDHTWIPSSRRKKDDCQQIADALAMGFATGIDIDWEMVHAAQSRMRLQLPTYPFEQSRYWAEPQSAQPGASLRVHGQSGIHPFFDVHIASAHEPNAHLFEGEFSLERFPFLLDHRVQGRIVFPGAAYAELGLAAKRVAYGRTPIAIENMEYESPLLLDPGERVQVQVRLEKTGEGSFQFAIFSHAIQDGADPDGNPEWAAHATGKLKNISSPADSAVTEEQIAAIQARCREEVDGADFYRKLAERGNQWGPSFQGLERIWRGDREVLGLIRVPDSVREQMEGYEWHPAVADPCGQSMAGTIPLEKTEGRRGGAMIGGSIDQVRLYAPLRGDRFWVHARLRDEDSESSNLLQADLRVIDENLKLVSDLEGARLWYLDESSPVVRAADWIYSVQFEPVARAAAHAEYPAKLHRWLILTDRHGVGEALGKSLETEGDQVTLIGRGEQNEGAAAAATAAIEELRRALASGEKNTGRFDGVVHLWSLDGHIAEDATVQDVGQALMAGAESVLLCMKELAGRNDVIPPRLWVITRGAQSIGSVDSPADPAHATVWGLARSFAAECSSMWGGIVDLPNQPGVEVPISVLNGVLRQSGGEEQLAIRNGAVLAARLARVPLSPAARNFQCRADATYVITGGLGGIALGLAAWLVGRGARHLALFGRTPLPPREEWDSVAQDSRSGRRIAAVRRLEAMGAVVHVGSVDVGNEGSLNAGFARLAAAGCPEVRGIFHTAGVMGYQPLREAGLDNFREMTAGKSLGGWLLHKWAAGKQLDCFVLFSSAIALINFPFVASYAAANAFLDGLAHRRKAQGDVAVAINWGLWSAEGMAEDVSERGLVALEARGMRPIPSEIGYELIGVFTQQKIPQAGVLPVDWEKWKTGSLGEVRSPFYDRLIHSASDLHLAESQDLRAEIAAARGAERLRLIRDVVRQCVATVLGLAESEFDDEVAISRLGLDSLMATELRNRLVARVGCSLPLVRLLEGPSAVELVQLLEVELEAAESRAAHEVAKELPEAKTAGESVEARGKAREAGILDKLDSLSEEDVDRLLNEMLTEEERAHDH
jgi:acyl transferase domain-containing protein/NAD(P)-dependent dehydrogenase (short-subunit alcohol dehydrogenase family)